jgi:hypothetical protein
MRRWLTAGVGVAAVTLVMTAGCARPAGVDGELTDDWAAAPEAQVWQPESGVCHKSMLVTASLSDYAPLKCEEDHMLETAFVGEFTGEAGKRQTPPPEGVAMRGAYEQCVGKAKEFLGDDYRTGRVEMRVIKPNVSAWDAGARWFRCDLMEFYDDSRAGKSRSGSLRGALAKQGALRLGCVTITEKNDEIQPFKPAACDKPHNGEFAGLYLAKDVPYPKNDEQGWDVLGRGCYGVIASYTGLKDDASLPRRINFIYTSPRESDWQLGDRAVTCTLYLDKNSSKLMKGAGPGAFPAK